MCLGETGVVIDVLANGRGRVRFDDDTEREVSLAVPIVEGVEIRPGDRVLVSIGMVLHVEGRADVVEQEMRT